MVVPVKGHILHYIKFILDGLSSYLFNDINYTQARPGHREDQ